MHPSKGTMLGLSITHVIQTVKPRNGLSKVEPVWAYFRGDSSPQVRSLPSTTSLKVYQWMTKIAKNVGVVHPIAG